MTIAGEMSEALLEAIDDGKQPIRWDMMLGAYHALRKELELNYTRLAIGVGSEVETLFDLPVTIISGAQKEWKLVVAH